MSSQKIIEKILASLAKKILKKYNPEIIGITGSMGKTSTKEAIFTVLKNSPRPNGRGKYNVRASMGNYNNELGLPLTIINAKTAGRNFLKWLPVFLKAWKLILKTQKGYPDILVLEMAAAHPGDIEYLVKIAPCRVGVVTAIGPAHVEFFKTIKNVVKEKGKLVSHLSKNGWAVLNADDELVYSMRQKTKAKILSYGLSAEADVRAEKINYETDGSGITCFVTQAFGSASARRLGERAGGPDKVEAEFKNVLSSSQLSSLLAAIAVAKIYNINLKDAINNLSDFKFPKGRLQIIPGIKNTLIIDDTYNSSPKAVKVALEVLSRIKCNGRRWAVLGDMLELGSFTESAHQEVGEWIKQYKINILVTVGERAIDIARVAERGGLSKECVVSFDDSMQAGKFIQKEISQGDLILVKGSQGMRMEKIVKEIMAEPMRAGELLVRQSKKWLDK